MRILYGTAGQPVQPRKADTDKEDAPNPQFLQWKY